MYVYELWITFALPFLPTLSHTRCEYIFWLGASSFLSFFRLLISLLLKWVLKNIFCSLIHAHCCCCCCWRRRRWWWCFFFVICLRCFQQRLDRDLVYRVEVRGTIISRRNKWIRANRTIYLYGGWGIVVRLKHTHTQSNYIFATRTSLIWIETDRHAHTRPTNVPCETERDDDRGNIAHIQHWPTTAQCSACKFFFRSVFFSYWI